jgi:hypothetical protein
MILANLNYSIFSSVRIVVSLNFSSIPESNSCEWKRS